MALHPLRIVHTDTARQEAFQRYISRVFPRLDFRPWFTCGGWTSRYEAHAMADGDEIVANVSVMRMRAVIGGREVPAAQLGAVGSVPEARGRGLVRSLLERVLAQLERETELVFLFANERVLDFYPRFGFRRAQESAFELETAVDPSSAPAPRLDLDDRAQRDAWLEACAASVPLTERFGVRDYGSVALWHACAFYRRDIHVLREGEAYAVAVQRGDTLHLLDLAARRRFELQEVVPRLARSPIARIRFGFCPELWCPAARAVGPSEDPLFVRGDVELPREPFQLPKLAET